MLEKRKFLFVGIFMVPLVAVLAIVGSAQTPTPSPTPTPARGETMFGGYKVTSAVEFGWRFRSLDGSENKYRSDLNYKPGFRTFDSNILMEAEKTSGKWFDSLLISNTGWGSDPSGFTRVNMERVGLYKFNVNVRRVSYFNNLTNHALNEHTQNTNHNMADFDVTILPQDERLRFTFGGSFNSTKGPGSWTTRAYSDEFPVVSHANVRSDDFRVGAEGKLLAFNWGITQGFRVFNDRSYYELTAPNVGNNPVGTAALATFSRQFPTHGNAYYTSLNLHRTFAAKLDFTGRLIYSSTDSTMSMIEQITGRDNSNNRVDLDQFLITSRAKRPQTRGDIGITYNVTDSFRLSNTFTFDKFAVNGGNEFEEALFRRNAAGGPLATTVTRTKGYRVNDYQKLVNTIEGDYQFRNLVGFHLGYRYTHRKVDTTGFDLTTTSPSSATNPVIISGEASNTTNTLIAGMKIKPTKNWVIFWDVEHGQADNVFTRVENYQFTNLRARTRLTFNKFALNFSIISKDNTNPSVSIVVPNTFNYVTDIKNRNYSGSVSWDPITEFSLNAGYSYRRLDSFTPIILPINNVSTLGSSEFLMRDGYGFIEVAAKPHKRVGIFAAYRKSRDTGQGDRISNAIQTIIGSYPMEFDTPEFKVAFRLTRNIDWNVGYQYYNYKDIQTPTQNYKAHLPYTSLRIYFGGRAGDR